MFYVVLGDLMTSFVPSMVIFGSLGYLAHLTGKPFADIVTSSSFGLGFVVFPKFFSKFFRHHFYGGWNTFLFLAFPCGFNRSYFYY